VASGVLAWGRIGKRRARHKSCGSSPNPTLSRSLGQWFLNCGEFPTGEEWRVGQVGDDGSGKKNYNNTQGIKYTYRVRLH